jgi:hypothetical protein
MIDAKDDFGMEWRPLVPDPKLEKLARVEQQARAIRHPFADVLAPLFDTVLALASDKGDDWEGASNEDYLVTDDKVWVTAAYVLRQLPPSALTIDGGRAIKRSMAANGWQTKRTAAARWYVKTRPSPE